ncbi:MAG: hypothetical protein IPG35_06570 [Flavobacteriales bacterium]|nr:hypothetical protein [Flavobacteriales bacterium]MBK9698920.1 hypothetical protein [Flavobacteriales bacterium]
MVQGAVLVAMAVWSTGILHAQAELHVLLNLANCEAHSRQIATLNDLPRDLKKTVWLSRSDSALTPWVVDRFALEGIKQLGFRYLSPQRLRGYLGQYGTSTCFVTVGLDTVDRFPLEALPSRAAEIKDAHARAKLDPAREAGLALIAPPAAQDPSAGPGSPSMYSVTTGRRATVVRTRRWKVERTADQGPISSAVQLVATQRSVWLLDEIVGMVYRMDLDTGDRVQLVKIGDAHALMNLASRSAPAAAGLAVLDLRSEGLIHARTPEEGCGLVMWCVDPAADDRNIRAARTQQVVLTLPTQGEPTLTRVIDRSAVDGRGLMLTPSGLGHLDSVHIAQIFKLDGADEGHPLFAELHWRGDSMYVGQTVPFDYFNESWEGLRPYQFVNGHFSADHFIYASAPRMVSLRDGKQSDLSALLAIPPGPVAIHMRQNYFTMSMHCEKDTISIVYFSNDALHLARIGHAQAGSYTPIDLTPIPLKGHDVKALQLIGTDQLLVLSAALDEVVLFTFE